ncbi:hypothetical protein [Actinopolymorpha pittospori]|uniref:Uncharacterized protein n=1 Tax=Actinopolymorpha pittospori TaxID=648752 RepID=A0A927MQL7_9ACTN|nr:hypothetical protein [Actinopolymorpha pittospori]MBE1604289.1 hypothetical protein [Actinopolymorpha pittospori]
MRTLFGTVVVVLAVALGSTGCLPKNIDIQPFTSHIMTADHDWWEAVHEIGSDCPSGRVLPCESDYAKAGVQAQRLARTIHCSYTPSCTGYLGKPPARIWPLLTDTEAAANEYTRAYSAWKAQGCTDPVDDVCGRRENAEVRAALKKVTDLFYDWQQYLR